MLQQLGIENVGPADRITIDFAERINLITGDNGLGKSFVLDVAWWAMTRSWVDRPATPVLTDEGSPRITWSMKGANEVEGQSEFDFEQWRWPQKPGRPPNPGLVVYARADGSFSVFDPNRNYWRDAASVGIHEPDRPDAFHFTAQEVWDGLRGGDGRFLCNGLTTDWVAWQRRAETEAWEQLVSVLKQLSEPGSQLTPGPPSKLDPYDAREYPTLDLGYDVVPLEIASAGMRRVCALAYLLVWTWQEHLSVRELQRGRPVRDITFLIDEVEAHLHPKWQRSILRSLVDVMTALGEHDGARVQVITATHSPLLPVSIEPIFDTKHDRIFTFDVVDAKPTLQEVPWSRHGDSHGWLTSEMFDLDDDRSPQAIEAIRLYTDAVMAREIDVARLDRVDEQLRRYLPENDLILRRWDAYRGRIDR